MDEKIALEIKNLKKYFPVKKGFFKRTVGYVKAVDGVSFHIGAGETFGLDGEFRLRKTTVGKLVMRLHEADAGEIRLFGKDITHLRERELRKERPGFSDRVPGPLRFFGPYENRGEHPKRAPAQV